MRLSKLFYLFMFLLLVNESAFPRETIQLNEGWLFRQVGTKDWLEAVVPGSVQQDLIRHGKLSNPLVGKEEQSILWVEEKDWEYQRQIPIDQLPPGNNINLEFKGLDTYASVYLNDSLLVKANNMFRSWNVPLPRSVFQPINTLRIVFHSVVEEGKKAQKRLGYPLPAPNDVGRFKVSSFIRKAPYQFGWDWSPRVVTCGIWKGVSIKAWDEYSFEDVRIIQDSLTTNAAFGRAFYTIHSSEELDIKLQLKIGDLLVDKTVTLAPGNNKVVLPFKFPNPELWWPNGWGGAYLYKAIATASHGSSKEQSIQKKLGFRTLELRREPDDWGTSFEFEVNGKPLFVKGANYVPQSVFPASINEAQYTHLLLSAKRAHFNMIRVWGGGVYEQDLFYDLCDSLGVLVWQDFMFACSMYPFDDAFISTIELEAKEQVARLSSHPCIALWCGNNEVRVAWDNWGWQDEFKYSINQQADIHNGYISVFQRSLPDVVKKFSPSSAYIHTSPLSNWGKNENFNHHNMHYWGVWHGTDDFVGMEKFVPRFMSEYGFQSFPFSQAYKGQVEQSHLSLKDSLLKHRQKSYKTTKELERHLIQHYPSRDDYDSFAYLSQLNQRLAMRMAIDAHRLDRNRCAGTLYWQLNDVWAAPTWSTIDHAGTWKAAHYMVKERYKPIVAIPKLEDDSIALYIANDLLDSATLSVQTTCLGFDGDTLFDNHRFVAMPGNSSLKLDQWALTEFLSKDRSKKEAFVLVRLLKSNEVIDKTTLFLTEPKDLSLTNITPEISFYFKDGKAIISVSSTTLIKDLFLSFNAPGQWTSNFADVLPGSPAQFIFTPKSGKAVSEQDLKVMTLNSMVKDLDK